jgi:hypothetical protein
LSTVPKARRFVKPLKKYPFEIRREYFLKAPEDLIPKKRNPVKNMEN